MVTRPPTARPFKLGGGALHIPQFRKRSFSKAVQRRVASEKP